MVETAGARMTVANHPKASQPGNWDADGWLLVPEFLDPSSLAALREESERLLEQPELFDQRGAVPNSPTRSDRLDPVIDLSPLFAELARSRPLLDAVSGVLGGEARLMKDKFIAKPPGAIGYAVHQDAAYWQGIGLDMARVLTAMIFLDDAPARSGPVECVAEKHYRLLTETSRIADPDESQVGEFSVIEAKAGDVLLLDAFVPHRSGPNQSANMRRAVMFTYAVDPRPDLYEIYARHRRA
jgi:hypothetical protein